MRHYSLLLKISFMTMSLFLHAVDEDFQTFLDCPCKITVNEMTTILTGVSTSLAQYSPDFYDFCFRLQINK